ncbi:MAG: histidine kinase [Tissierellia bacterium]|nr:histidine kinase [Tissierellia bacterium]
MKSIQSKINLYVTASLLILFILLLYNIDRDMNKTVIPLSKDLTNQIVKARAGEITNWLDERTNEIKLIGNQIYYSNMNLIEGLNYLNFILKYNNTYESLGIIDEDGIAWISDGSKFSIANREYYREIKEGESTFVISNPLRSRSNEIDIVIMIYRLPENISSKFEYISAAVPIETIKDIAAAIRLYDGGSKIYDTAGNPIGNDDEDIQINEDIIEFSAPIEHSPEWTIVFKVPEYRLYEGTRKIQSSATTIGLLIGGALIVLLTFFSDSIVKPIRKIQEQMRIVETGDLTVRFKDYRKDEIGDLQKSFDQMLDKLYKVKYEKREIELRLLHEQINPHFLYNTLDTIRWSAIEYDATEVVDLIEALSTYFRIGLSRGKKYITLSDELDHLESYFRIHQARFEDSINYKIKYDESLIQSRVIRVLLQPIVENAIYHGNKNNQNNNFKIMINIYKDKDMLVMEVKNNGEKIPEEKLILLKSILSGEENQDDRIGFGLYSVNQRIKLAFGDKYGVDIGNENGWTLIKIRCPLIEGEDDYDKGFNSR